MKTKVLPEVSPSVGGNSSTIPLRHIQKSKHTKPRKGSPCHWSQHRALQQRELTLTTNNSSTRRYGRLELQHCPEILRTVFEGCQQEVFVRVTCAISCVLSSEQRLSVQALSEAVALYMEYQEHTISARECMIAFQSSLTMLESLFSTTASGQLTFTTPTMPQFLRTYPIRGIDVSHRTIAMLCREQMQRIHEEEHENRQPAHDRSAFSAYAVQNWQHHYRIAKRTSLFLNLRNTFSNSASPVFAHGSPLTYRQCVQENHKFRAQVHSSPSTSDDSCSDEWEIVDVTEVELG